MTLANLLFITSALLFAGLAFYFRSKYILARDLQRLAEHGLKCKGQLLREALDELQLTEAQYASVAQAGREAHRDCVIAQTALRELHDSYFNHDGDMRLRLIRRHEAMKAARKLLGLPETAQVIDIRSSLKN